MRLPVWRLPVWRRRQQEDLNEEIASHLRMAIDERVERGEALEAAAREARREFGNIELVKETTRDTWGWMSVDRLFQDVRYALRMLRRSPGFSLVALITLALGIGANTAIFSVINAVLLRPLPFPQPDRLVAVQETDLREDGAAIPDSVSYPNFFDWRDRNRTFAQLAAFRQTRMTLLAADGGPESLAGAVVSSDFFDTLGVRPLAGRAFRRDEERAGNDVVVLGENLWRSHFSAAADIVGRKVTLNSRLFTVVGVMPADFRFPLTFPATEAWIGIAEDARTDTPDDTPMTAQRGAAFLKVIGRLRPGISIERAQADMSVIARALSEQYRDDDGRRGARVAPELDVLVGGTKFELLLLLGAVGCVLLIACANIANLLLARGIGRAREMSLRSALGASGFRLIRQLLTESVVLSSAGAALGLLVAYGSLGFVVRLSPVDIRGLDQVAIDGPVVAFAALIAVVTALLFGVMPALHAATPDLTAGLKQGGRTAGGRAQHRSRELLVVVETALGVVLLVAAGLMLRSFDRLSHAAPGFDPRNVVTLRFRLPDSKYTYEQQVRFYDGLFPALHALPGVQAVAGVAPLPLSGNNLTISFERHGHPMRPEQLPTANLAVVSVGYFDAMRIPTIRGRSFTVRDGLDAPRVVVVDQAFARRFFPNEDPIGKRIKPGLRSNEKETPWREIVGIVGDVKQQRLGADVQPTFYIPYAQGLITSLHLVVRSAGGASAAVDAVRKTVASHDPELAIWDVRTMDEYVDRSIAGTRFDALLLALFAGVALILTALGLYGVTANAVAERTQEFGIRIALGAAAASVVVSVVRRGAMLTGIGLAFGILGATLTSRLLTNVLYGVRPLDPTTFVAVAVMLFVVGLFACWLPARRATEVDPIRALRSE